MGSVEIQDNVVQGEKVKLYNSLHKKKIEAEEEGTKIAIKHLKDFLNFEVDDFNLHDKEMYRQHLKQVDFALVEALQENKALKDEIAKLTAMSKFEKIMN
ncbi:hypothetical protein RHSIM_Rhsim07G0196600 [Rhododendron simsii]|uniref:Uncharacterized protein n=1 Tax=Rhododendron simsii TaxID=118357 RepID=A0A834LJE8_RHOSS|nr:hypothetical protein RHSIM_Rhsim07G0196600 [Rhododendron simsii]